MDNGKNGKNGKAVGYIRVSTDRQEADGQREAIRKAVNKAGYDSLHFAEEVISSRKEERQVYQIVKGLQRGETMVVYELSRLGRSIGEVFDIVHRVRKKGAFLWVLEPNLHIEPGQDLQADSLLFALSVGAQVERNMISERTKTALAERKRQGVKLGRPEGSSKLKEHDQQIREWQDLGVTKANIARLLGVSRSALYDYLNKRDKVRKGE